MCTDIVRYQDKIQDFQDRQIAAQTALGRKKDRIIPMTLKEYLAQAPERDKKAKAARAAKEAAEDAYFDAMSDLVDTHPIGRPVPHGGCGDPS